jgi:hypothetical protein
MRDSMWSEALARALGAVVAEHRREWARELAEARASVAELVARCATLEADVHARCKHAGAVAIEAAVAGLRQPRDGVDGVTLEALEPLVEAIVGEKFADLPAAPPGRDGAPGLLPIVKEWSDRVHYAGEVVTFFGATWQAMRDTGRTPLDVDDWICIAAAGCNGADGGTPNPRGLWSAGEPYRRLDVVMVNGSSFVAAIDDPGPCPGDGWRLLAARGRSGKPGEPGRAATASPIAVVGLAVDGEGLLTLINGDGSTVTCDLFPVLDKVRR